MVSIKTNIILDSLLLVNFLICALSGFFMRNSFWGMSVREIHFISAKILIFLVLVHIILHWGFIKNILRKND